MTFSHDTILASFRFSRSFAFRFFSLSSFFRFSRPISSGYLSLLTFSRFSPRLDFRFLSLLVSSSFYFVEALIPFSRHPEVDNRSAGYMFRA